MKWEQDYASKGVAGAGLGTGIAGLSLGVLNALGLETVPFYAKKMLAQHKESFEALCIYRAKDDTFDRDTLKNLLDEIMDKEKSLTVKFGGHSFTFEQADLDELFMGLN